MDDGLRTALSTISKELAVRNLRYALIGGLAASLRGRVRATDDVDLIILCSLDEALALVSSLRKSEFSSLVEDAEEIARTALLIPLIHDPTNIQLDLAVGLSGFEREIVERADPMMLGEVEIFVATAEDLILLKLIADRPQDRQDVEGIVDVQADEIDWNYCMEIAQQLKDAVSIDLETRIGELKRK